MNTRSSTESEVVGDDEMMPMITWACYFLLSQGYGIIENLLLQDNKSLILLEQNEKALSGKCNEAYQHPILLHHRLGEHEGHQH